MWLKTLGLILVIASCSGIGAEAVHRLRERLGGSLKRSGEWHPI